MAEKQLPFIFKRETKIGSSGAVIEERQLTVQGESLKETEQVFDRKWMRDHPMTQEEKKRK